MTNSMVLLALLGAGLFIGWVFIVVKAAAIAYFSTKHEYMTKVKNMFKPEGEDNGR